MKLNDVYKDAAKAKELTDNLFGGYVYESDSDFGEASDIAREAGELLAQVADDFAALDQALTGTRPE